MLILFDIDGTLVTSHRVGLRSIHQACRLLHGENFTFDGVEVAGRLDPLIIADACRVNGIDPTPQTIEQIRIAYRTALQQNIEAEQPVQLLPGIRTLLDHLSQDSSQTLALLTGNFPETARMKIEAAGLRFETFAFGAWGNDGPTRNDLPPIAFAHFRQRFGVDVDPRLVTVIGDTPHDIACARTHGCRVIAVATGIHSTSDLAPHTPDLLLENLADTNSILDWLLQPVA